MSSQHKAPLAAFFVVSIACALVLVQSLRSEALRGVLFAAPAISVVEGLHLVPDALARDGSDREAPASDVARMTAAEVPAVAPTAVGVDGLPPAVTLPALPLAPIRAAEPLIAQAGPAAHPRPSQASTGHSRRSHSHRSHQPSARKGRSAHEVQPQAHRGRHATKRHHGSPGVRRSDVRSSAKSESSRRGSAHRGGHSGRRH